MRLPGNPAQTPPDDPPLHYAMSFPYGATVADGEAFLTAARRAGAEDGTLLITVSQDGRTTLLAVPVPDGGTTSDLSEVHPVTAPELPAQFSRPAGSMRRV